MVGNEYNRHSLSHQTVKAIWTKFCKFQEVSNQWAHIGRPLALTEEDLVRLEKYFDKNPKESIEEAKFSLGLSASRQTINRALLQRGIRSYRSPKKIYISPRNVQKRMEFAEKYEDMTMNYWKKLLFSDESSFTLYNSNGRLLIRRPEEKHGRSKDFQIDGQCESLMVWGIISFNGVGPLVRIDQVEEGEDTLNGERYLTILKRYLLRNYSSLAMQRLIFQQDNAPAHRYHGVQSYLDEKQILKIKWPPQSPDMSIIEDIWNEMKFRIRGKVYKNKEKLWKDLQREWKLISKEFVRNLYESLPRRVHALKKIKRETN